MGIRDLVFSIWAKFGTHAATVAALLEIAAGNYAEIQQGGRKLVSSSVNGQQFSFSQSSSFPITVFARTAWIKIKDMTDAELQSWLETETNSFTEADFSMSEITG